MDTYVQKANHLTHLHNISNIPSILHSNIPPLCSFMQLLQTKSCNRGVDTDNVTWMCNSHNHPFHDLGGNIDLSSQLMIYETQTSRFNVRHDGQKKHEIMQNDTLQLQPAGSCQVTLKLTDHCSVVCNSAVSKWLVLKKYHQLVGVGQLVITHLECCHI